MCEKPQRTRSSSSGGSTVLAELVERRLHLPEGHQPWLVTAGRRLVAHQVGHRQAQARGQPLAVEGVVHPGAGALVVRAAVGVAVEGGHVLAGLVANAKEA